MLTNFKELMTDLASPAKILLIIGVALAAHLLVLALRRLGNQLITSGLSASFAKIKTLASLLTSILVFVVYFAAVGRILTEFGVSLKAYLASASILGLAIGFGSQGIVQDVVTGLTVIFSDLFEVGDMVEISGQVGFVKSVGMRFTVITNSLGAEVFIPNRTIGNVVNYPRGYVRCLADVILSKDQDLACRTEDMTKSIVATTFDQFPGIFLTPPTIEGRKKTSSGREFLRVKFRIWPGRGTTIETTFKQELVQVIKEIDPAYADWMVAVNYEVEKKPVFLTFSGGKKNKVPHNKTTL